MKIWQYVIVVAVVLSAGLVAGAAEKKEFTASADRDGVQRIEVVAGSYFFNPNYIIVKVNVPVEIKIRKEAGLAPHDFILKAPDAGIEVVQELSTDPAVVKFTPTKVGKYDFYCGKKVFLLGSHRDKGMEGVLEVRE